MFQTTDERDLAQLTAKLATIAVVLKGVEAGGGAVQSSLGEGSFLQDTAGALSRGERAQAMVRFREIGIRPEQKYMDSGKHGLDWTEGPNLAKRPGPDQTPQGQWGSVADLEWAATIAVKLGKREGGVFPMPEGNMSLVHRIDGWTVPAETASIRNNGNGTFHGHPKD